MKGLFAVTSSTAKPSRMRSVRSAMAACSISGQGLCPISRKKCISVSQQ